MADQAALIATLSVRMDKFEKQMKAAGTTAEDAVKDIEDKFAKANPQVGSIAKGTFLGNLASGAAKQVFAFVKELPEQFEKLAKAADIAGVSITEAFTAAGVVGGMEQGAKLLTDIGLQLEKIRQGGKDTPLQRLFEANNITIGKDAVTVTNQIVNLLRDATTAQQQLAKQSGLVTDEMIKAANAGKDFATVEEKVTKINTGFLSLIAWLKELTLQAQIWGLTMVGWILEAGAKGDEMLARLAAGLRALKPAPGTVFGTGAGATNVGPMGSNTAPVSTETAQPTEGLSQTAQAAKDAAEQVAKYRKELEELQKKAKQFGPEIPADFGKAGIKIPVDGGKDAKSAVDREIERLEKRREVLEAETQTIGQNTEAQAKAKAMAELNAAAKKDEAEGRKVNKERLEEEAAAYAKTVDENAKKTKTFNDALAASALVGNALSSAFADAVLEGKKLNDVMQSLLKTLARAAINAAFTSLFAKEGLGGLFGGLLKRQGGGPVMGGSGYIVGEKGPEIFLPNTSGMIVPNHSLGGSTMNVNISLAGANGDATIQKIAYQTTQAGMAAALRQVPQLATAAVADASRRGSM